MGGGEKDDCFLFSVCRISGNFSMIWFCSVMKCRVSLSSFVNRSVMFIDPAMCLTCIILLAMASLMVFLRIWICRSPFVVMLPDHVTHAELSL